MTDFVWIFFIDTQQRKLRETFRRRDVERGSDVLSREKNCGKEYRSANKQSYTGNIAAENQSRRVRGKIG
jgi:hypothetical protein